MILLCDKYTCTGCEACYSSCNKNAIEMHQDDEGFLQPIISYDKCVECNCCIKSCPILSPIDRNSDIPLGLYALYNNDDKIRRNSTSGGFFSVISKYFLEDLKGYACGAVFDESFKVVHQITNSVDKIYMFTGSKYVQSNIGNCFKEIKVLLKQQISVVFSGTPCQVAGLLNFLGRSYDNLVTVELVCHGVPSPLFWKKYVEHKERKIGSKLKAVNFRDKKYGFGSGTMKLSFANGLVYNKGHEADLMLRPFSQNMISRNSCYDCHFKGMENHYADFIIYDGWHIGKWNRKMNDDKGVTLVYVRNNKALSIILALKNKIVMQKVSISDKYAEIDAVMLYKSAKKNKYRDELFVCLNEKGFNAVVAKYFPVTLKVNVKSYLKLILHYIGVMRLINKYKRLI